MKNKCIAVVGASGKMGGAVAKKLQNNYKIIEIDYKNSINEAKNADLVIDFTNGNNSAEVAKFCAEQKIPLIVGSTGQSEAELNDINRAAEVVPILFCKNFSIGIFMLKKIIDVVYSMVEPDTTIFEKHHKMKKDSPSGTALDLEKYIHRFRDKPISILAERGGAEIGTHRLDFYFGDELVSVSHQAFSREAFVCGVQIATEFMLNVSTPKLYSFDEILQEKLN